MNHTTTTHARPLEVLVFNLGTDEYGIDILKVQEIRGYDAVTPIAHSKSFMKGVINLRGVIVPIFDLRIRFGFKAVQYDAFTVVIVLKLEHRVIGVVVDGVADVLSLHPENYRPVPDFGLSVDTSYLSEIAMLDERMVILLNIDQLVVDGILSGQPVGADAVTA